MQRVTTHDGKFDETSEEISLSNKYYIVASKRRMIKLGASF